LFDTDFEELVSDMSFTYKEKAARQIHNTSQSTNISKKDKVKKVLALINKIQNQDSCSSDEESNQPQYH
jgi:hypothetical protein